MKREVRIGQLFEMDVADEKNTFMVHNLTQGDDPNSVDFGAWYVRRNAVGNGWEMYGFGGSVNVRHVSNSGRWLPVRLSVLQIARAAKAYGFDRNIRRRLLSDYDKSRLFDED